MLQHLYHILEIRIFKTNIKLINIGKYNMKEIKNFINEAYTPLAINKTSRVTWANVHDAVLNTLMKYYRKPGISKEVTDYCDKVRDALNSIK